MSEGIRATDLPREWMARFYSAGRRAVWRRKVDVRYAGQEFKDAADLRAGINDDVTTPDRPPVTFDTWDEATTWADEVD